jgi:hypothetical protein
MAAMNQNMNNMYNALRGGIAQGGGGGGPVPPAGGAYIAPQAPFAPPQAAAPGRYGAAATPGQHHGNGGNMKVPPFSSGKPADWAIWKRNYLLAAEVNQWDDQRSRLQAAGSMEGDAARMVADLAPSRPGLPGGFLLADLMEEYESRFLPAAESHLALQEFMVAKQKGNETVLLWHGRVREMFIRAYPGRPYVVDRDLIYKFQKGLSDTDILLNCMRSPPPTYALALEKANTETAAKIMHSGRLPRAPQIHAMGAVEEGENEMDESFQNKAKSIWNTFAAGGSKPAWTGGTTKSWGSQRDGDRPPRGDAGDRACFFCAKKGHLRANCELWNKAMTQFKEWAARKGTPDGTARRGDGAKGGRKSPFPPKRRDRNIFSLEGGMEEMAEETMPEPEDWVTGAMEEMGSQMDQMAEEVWAEN